MQFDAFELHLLLANLFAQNIHYDIGKRSGQGKVAVPLSTEPSSLNGRGIDCSGFVQYVIVKTTLQISFPRGSATQKEWCEENGYKTIEYTRFAPLQDNQVRIGFRKTIPGPILVPKTSTKKAIRGKKKQTGHVWLVINGKTYESTKKAGNNGPASLLWSLRTADADYFYTLGQVPAFKALCDRDPI